MTALMTHPSHPSTTPAEDGTEPRHHPSQPITSVALALLPLRLFLAAGWLRAAAEKVIEPAWWRGDTLRAFLDTQHDEALPFVTPVLDHLIAPGAVLVAAVVAVTQILIGVAIGTGRHLRPALWWGVVLNTTFVLSGRVNPSAFYLVMELVLLQALAVGLLAGDGTRPTRRTIQPRHAAPWLAAAAIGTPFITTLAPAEVIEDPAMMLVFLCAIVGLVQLLRWLTTTLQPERGAVPAPALVRVDGWITARPTDRRPIRRNGID